jgi:hypothetical protein
MLDPSKLEGGVVLLSAALASQMALGWGHVDDLPSLSSPFWHLSLVGDFRGVPSHGHS